VFYGRVKGCKGAERGKEEKRCSRTGRMCIVPSFTRRNFEDDLLKAFGGKIVSHCVN